MKRSENEWRALLKPEEYRVMREKDTEIPYRGKYYKTDQSGVYHCNACDLPLFSSSAKFDSDCGWPSFFQPVDDTNIMFRVDYSHNMKRIEVLCSQCESHLGHVFPDGPQPTGLRFCINSVCLLLHETEKQVL